MIKTTIGIEGMACGMCEAHINDAIRHAFNVKSVKASLKKKNAEIISEEELGEEELHKVIDPTGYTMTSYAAEPYVKKGLFH